MNRTILAASLLIGIAVCAVPATSLAVSLPVHYRVTAIVPTTPSEDNLPESLNAGGIGTGRMISGSADGDRALVFSNGATQKLGILPTTGSRRFSYGYGINDLGHVVGESSVGDSDASTNPHAFLFANNSLVDLGTIGGTLSAARGVNNADQVVGRSSSSAGKFVPFLWQNGQFINLGSFGGSNGGAEDINNLGHVVGSSTNSSAFNLAFFWSDRNGNQQSDDGEMISLGLLPNFDQAIANALNASDTVVGQLIPSSGSLIRAFRWADTNGNHVSDPGEMTLFPMLSDGVASNASDINALGLAVGQSRFADFSFRATVWKDSQAIDLNTLVDLSPGQTVPVLESALSINDAGQILAMGRVATGLGNKSRVYLLTPVPEPGGAGLAAIGLATVTCCLAAGRHRRRQGNTEQAGRQHGER